jgi:hypothetical protein
MEPLKEETEAERLKREQTAQEGRKMVRESVERVLKGPALARAESRTLNAQEGQEPEKEPESQELTEQLKGVCAQVWRTQGLTPPSRGVVRKDIDGYTATSEPGPGAIS